ncbi:M20 aminoacylase family protein [Burkholderia sp. Ac-20379]|uniref:M20 aminoacylase family protein n=1 Tax=Burkholderia sp. Ac-20379 TaxID=2703900 RepID=UPI00197F3249|nr:M20 aminoacylase family protein [Burkholderia sp. Ac-20379]MBN3727749.1 amidohydrolase [Burkholderia sp. Ac-20379]
MTFLNDPRLGAIEPDLIRIRRHLHAHPELRHEERETSDYVARLLTSWGIDVERDIGGYGLVGVLRCGRGTRSIGLRADMDALPMQEQNRFAHASRHPGKMHACGHDGHTAMLLGAARYLSEHRDFDGTVNFIFQPAEEGGAGARLMIEDGLFERCPMDAVFGAHNWPGIAAGSFALRPGPIMASSNTFSVALTGAGAHAAQPHRAADPVVAATALVQAWQSIVARNIDPNEAAVLSVTEIHAGSAINVIPGQATLSGTVRAFKPEVLDRIEQRMRELAQGIASAYEMQLDFAFNRMYPPLVNHRDETAFAAGVLESVFGAASVDAEVAPQMPSEDFSFYMQHRPGCYVFIGNGDGSEHGNCGCAIPLHNPNYDFNDALLKPGMAWWVSLVKAWLPKVAAKAA